ncbi:hypothetical protein ILYODFUR_023159 [Ilyodon furcidens]|uniref:Uncharacterized protein n=1 Tax=Ilyodon furcidens TaxID=33524 RepID=A0ABV0VHU6_9TELE
MLFSDNDPDKAEYFGMKGNFNISPVILLARVIFLFKVFHSLCCLTNLLLSTVSIPLNHNQLHSPQPLLLPDPCGAGLLCEGSLVPLRVITVAQRNVRDHSKSDAFRCSLFLNPQPGKTQLSDSDTGNFPNKSYLSQFAC